MDTVWVLGDQLNRNLGALARSDPGEVTVLMIESDAKVGSKPFHRQRLHFVLASMRTFADELRQAGYRVDYRRAPSFAAGLAAHRAQHHPDRIVATEPASWDGQQMLQRAGVETVRSDQFLCHYEDFAAWAADRKRLRMEDFYRWRRVESGYLMDGDQPAGGRWNFDADNRRFPPPGETWPPPPRTAVTAVDRELDAALPDRATGDPVAGYWATSRRGAQARLRHVVKDVLPRFGPFEDAMLAGNWHLAHSLLSPYLNIGLLLPGEVCDAVDDAWRTGTVPVASAEGFLRQVLGWREYVWGLYWLWMPGYRSANHYRADQELPPSFGGAPTEMRCVSHTVAGIKERAYAHHIQRLMVLGNLSLLAGVEPTRLVDWMWASFIDGAEWVMLPNVVGMALHADGGRMATKPYAAGGAYINRMSDYCGSCRFDPRQRTGEDACPFTTLYWDFLARNRPTLSGNHRMRQALSNLDRLGDLEAVRARAGEVRRRLADGAL